MCRRACRPAQSLGLMDKRRAIDQCRDRILPRCGELATRLSSQPCHVSAKVVDAAVGAATPYDGHIFGVECTFPHAPQDAPDNVALVVELGTRQGTLELSADVCWGEGQIEFSLLPENTSASDEAIANIAEAWSQLDDALLQAIRRGRPA
jgi:hypothetical protein